MLSYPHRPLPPLDSEATAMAFLDGLEDKLQERFRLSERRYTLAENSLPIQPCVSSPRGLCGTGRVGMDLSFGICSATCGNTKTTAGPSLNALKPMPVTKDHPTADFWPKLGKKPWTQA